MTKKINKYWLRLLGSKCSWCGNRTTSTSEFHDLCDSCFRQKVYDSFGKKEPNKPVETFKDKVNSAFKELLKDPEFVDQLQWHLALSGEEKKNDPKI